MHWLLFAVIFAPAADPSIPVHDPTPGNDVEPTAVFTDEGLVVAWIDSRPSSAAVVYAHSPDLRVFSAPISVSGFSGSTETIRPHLAARGEQVVLTWADASEGDHDVYAATSNDGGRTFNAPFLVAGGAGGQQDPRAAILDDGSIAVVFHDSFGSTGQDRGLVRRIRMAIARPLAAFGPPQTIGVVDPQLAFDLFPAIAGSSSTVAVTWLREHHDRSTEIMLARSFDRGATFDPETAIDAPMYRDLRPRIAMNARGPFAIWDAIDDGENVDIAAPGRSINTTRALNQLRGDVAAFGDRILVAWVDHSAPGVRRIVLRESADGGENFGEEKIISADDQKAEVDHPVIAVRDNAAVIVFQDARGGSWDVRATILP